MPFDLAPTLPLSRVLCSPASSGLLTCDPRLRRRRIALSYHLSPLARSPSPSSFYVLLARRPSTIPKPYLRPPPPPLMITGNALHRPHLLVLRHRVTCGRCILSSLSPNPNLRHGSRVRVFHISTVLLSKSMMSNELPNKAWHWSHVPPREVRRAVRQLHQLKPSDSLWSINSSHATAWDPPRRPCLQAPRIPSCFGTVRVLVAWNFRYGFWVFELTGWKLITSNYSKVFFLIIILLYFLLSAWYKVFAFMILMIWYRYSMQVYCFN
jgi:hypothetical protein